VGSLGWLRSAFRARERSAIWAASSSVKNIFSPRSLGRCIGVNVDTS
jgi:hypothetical protein